MDVLISYAIYCRHLWLLCPLCEHMLVAHVDPQPELDVCGFRGKLIHEYMLRLVFRIEIIGDVRL